MNRFLLAVLALLAFVVDARADERPPNVVLFLVDDMGWTDVGCNGSTFHETPHVDGLAKQGTRFTDAYAACPVCSPTRASLVTGRYPATVDITDFISGHWRPYEKTIVPRFKFELPHEETTFAELLKPRGYVSGMFGKWHLGGRMHYPDSQGFDDWIVTSNSAFAPKFRITAGRPFEPKPQEYQAEYLTRAAERFLTENAAKPFVLFLSHSDVHIPLEAQRRLVAKYEEKAKRPEFAPRLSAVLTWDGPAPEGLDATVEHLETRARAIESATKVSTRIEEHQVTTALVLDPAADVAAARALFARNVALVKPPAGASLSVRAEAVNHPVYAAMCEHVDESLGRVLAKLDELEIADDTIVLFFSDNGGLFRRFDDTGPATATVHPLRGEKGSLYEGGIRVPFIARWPGVTEPGSTCAEPVSSVDLFPTMAEAAGINVPENVDGTSLVPLLRGEAIEREAIYWHYPHYHHTSPAGAIRAGNHKLIEYFEDGRLELYDLAADPGEHRNLANGNVARAIELRKQLADWRASVGAKLPTPNPNHDPARAAEWGNRKDRGF